MTAPTPPDTLRALAERLPERVRSGTYGGYAYFEAFYLGDWQYVLWVDAPFNPDVTSGIGLEYALREECQARGWEWSTGAIKATPSRPHEPWAKVAGGPTIYADSPAHALARAFLAALTAEGGR